MTIAHPHPTPDAPLPPPLAASPAFLLSKVGATALRLFASALEPLGLRPRHYTVMASLATQGAQSQQMLCDRLRIDGSGMVALVDELEGRLLAERRRDPQDRRRYAVHITDKGRELLAEAEAASDDVQNRLLAPLRAEQRSQLHELLLAVARVPRAATGG